MCRLLLCRVAPTELRACRRSSSHRRRKSTRELSNLVASTVLLRPKISTATRTHAPMIHHRQHNAPVLLESSSQINARGWGGRARVIPSMQCVRSDPCVGQMAGKATVTSSLTRPFIYPNLLASSNDRVFASCAHGNDPLRWPSLQAAGRAREILSEITLSDAVNRRLSSGKQTCMAQAPAACKAPASRSPRDPDHACGALRRRRGLVGHARPARGRPFPNGALAT